MKQLTKNKSAIYLVIVESPSKCSKIENYLGPQYACIASVGHLRYIPGLKSINIKQNYNVTYEFIEKKKQHIYDMKNLIQNFNTDNIFIATDDDREGEAIGWHICEIFNLNINTTKRIIFREITKTAITNAVQNPKTINMNIVKSAIARQVLDLIVGYRISPLLWKHIYNNKDNPLSAGRCQTPTLKIIYENSLIDRKNEYDHKINGIFTSKKLIFTLNKHIETKDKIESFLDLSRKHEHILSQGKDSKSILNPPKPFNTSKLLQHCSNAMSTSPNIIMKLCQELYQAGCITYMRTDSTKYASEFISHCRNYIVEKYEDAYLGNTNMIINTNKNDPHEAIRVTNIKKEFLDINVKDKRAKTLYKIIWKNTIQSCMSVYKSHIYKYLITAPNDLYYEYKNEIPTFLGWKILDDKVDAVNLSTYFKTLLNKPIQYNEIYNEICMNKSVHYYTESSLIHKLETLGIGRPSTFSTIVNTNIERKYIDKTDIPGTNVEYNKYLLKKDIINVNVETKQLGGEKNKLKITNLGVLCLEFLDKMFENIFSYDYTSNMETLLDNISNGSEEQWHNICDECYKEISTQLKTGNKVEKLEYPLNKGYIFLFEKYGPVLKKIDEDNKVTYVNVRKDIDIDIGKLINNEYDVDDLMFNNNNIGTYNDNPIYINQGPYGYYLECGNIKKTLKNYKGDINNIKQDDAIKILSEEANNSNILLELTSNLSIRKGKYGAYAFYKTPSMKKPDFLNIKKMSKGFSTASKNEIIDWICDKYNLNKNNI